MVIKVACGWAEAVRKKITWAFWLGQEDKRIVKKMNVVGMDQRQIGKAGY